MKNKAVSPWSLPLLTLGGLLLMGTLAMGFIQRAGSDGRSGGCLLCGSLAALVSSSDRWDDPETKRSVPPEKVLSGGPPKDGIPALDRPHFGSWEEVDRIMAAKPLVLIVKGEGKDGSEVVKAYPFPILVWHEVVNDEIAGEPVAITYCPLCATAYAFRRTVGDRVLSFGVSGRLYNSNLLMYDRQTESLWSQALGEAVVGELTGTRLSFYPSQVIPYRKARRRYPDALVLTTRTGYARPYGRWPYGDYDQRPEIFFPVESRDDRLPAKELIIGIRTQAGALAIPLKLLREQGRAKAKLGSQEITVTFDPESEEIGVTVDGRPFAGWQRSFWFAWAAFFPKTLLWQPTSD